MSQLLNPLTRSKRRRGFETMLINASATSTPDSKPSAKTIDIENVAEVIIHNPIAKSPYPGNNIAVIEKIDTKTEEDKGLKEIKIEAVATERANILIATEQGVQADMEPNETSFDRFFRARSYFAANESNEELKLHTNEVQQSTADSERFGEEQKPLKASTKHQEPGKVCNKNQELTTESKDDNKLSGDNHEKKRGFLKTKQRRLTLDCVFGAAWNVMKPVDRKDSKKIKVKEEVTLAENEEKSPEALVIRLINMLSVDDKKLKEINCLDALPILTDLLTMVKKR